MATLRPATGVLPKPASHPETVGRLNGSDASCPLQMSNQRAVSRTLRVMPPIVTVRFPYSACGPRGMRPYVDFKPTRPLKPAGIRIEPPPSPPVPNAKRPPATPAAPPPDDPPGVRSRFHGLRVTPLRTVRVTLTPPNSLAVVRPK